MSLAELLDFEPEPWYADALCAQLGPDCAEAWFPHPHDRARSAKAVCARCPVSTQCLTYALENRIREGIWGGLGDGERRRLVKQMRVAS